MQFCSDICSERQKRQSNKESLICNYVGKRSIFTAYLGHYIIFRFHIFLISHNFANITTAYTDYIILT